MSQYSTGACFLLIFGVLTGCGRPSAPTISGIYGSVEINSVAAPPGTLISFVNRENDSDSFTTNIGENGSYDYQPPGSIRIPPGEYVAVIRPVTSKTVVDEDGMQRDEPIPGAPKSYGKYSEVKTSDLVVQLKPGSAEKFDISVQTNQK